VLAKALFVSDIMSDMPRGCRKISKCSNSRRQLLPELTGFRKTSRATPRVLNLTLLRQIPAFGMRASAQWSTMPSSHQTCEKAMMHAFRLRSGGL